MITYNLVDFSLLFNIKTFLLFTYFSYFSTLVHDLCFIITINSQIFNIIIVGIIFFKMIITWDFSWSRKSFFLKRKQIQLKSLICVLFKFLGPEHNLWLNATRSEDSSKIHKIARWTSAGPWVRVKWEHATILLVLGI